MGVNFATFLSGMLLKSEPYIIEVDLIGRTLPDLDPVTALQPQSISLYHPDSPNNA